MNTAVTVAVVKLKWKIPMKDPVPPPKRAFTVSIYSPVNPRKVPLDPKHSCKYKCQEDKTTNKRQQLSPLNS